MLNTKQIDTLRIWLDKKLTEINDSVKKSNTGLIDYSQRSPEQLDLASQEISGRLNIRIKERESKLASKVELALEKIENGTFGICEECGEEISRERLMARPVTTFCIQCKQEQEAQERNRAFRQRKSR